MHIDKKKYLVLLIVFAFGTQIVAQQSKLVSIGANGKLNYNAYTEKGDILPDFSYCGYMGGGVAIPNLKVVKTIKAPSGKNNDAPMIQKAIDDLAVQEPDKRGFRGAILLKKGIYRIGSPIRISAGGIVLRGEGNNKKTGTIFLATGDKKYNVIEVGENARPRNIGSSEAQIVDDYVPSGTRVIRVTDARKKFEVGDSVVIQRPSTAEWINAIGMDSIAPRPLKGETTAQAFERFREQSSTTDMNGTELWKPNSRNLHYERVITSIKGDQITLDIPLTNAFQKEYGGGKIYKYTFAKRISQCGVENIYGMSVYDESVKEKSHLVGGEYFSDEDHANVFILLQAVENAWVQNVNVEHFDICVSAGRTAKYITAQDLSAINPISKITGGRRYAYNIEGQMVLFQRCYGELHRHQFVQSALVAGPNAFVDSRGENALAFSEPHQRWATGCLYDNIILRGPEAALVAGNRGNMGSGHGWAGAQMIFWNCEAPLILVMQPPTAQNFSIGCKEIKPFEWNANAKQKGIRVMSSASMMEIPDNGTPSVGTGWIESPTQEVQPASLYYQQLKDRLGEKALKNVMTQEQIDKFVSIND